MVEYSTEDGTVVGAAHVLVSCANVKMGHKHGPHIHDRYSTGPGACQGYPKMVLIYSTRSN